jgi:tetratricopeptide (TPR) repeat protein
LNWLCFICSSIANINKHSFWAIFWIDASTNDTAKEGFLDIARTCEQEPNFDSIMAWLSGKDHWFLIIDNADDPKLDISKFFPRGTKGSILITTRNPDFRKYATAGSSFKVDEMRPEDAVALLLKTAAVENVRDQEERDAAAAIVKVLGNFALAIIQAGAVIRQGLCSLRGFCELYVKQKKELLESGRAESSIDYQYSVYTTWEISIRKIEAIPDTYAKLALELLRLFAFMHFDAIKEEIFIKAQQCRDLHDDNHDPNDGSIYRATEIAKLMEAGWNSVLFRKAVGVLVAFSLVSVDDFERISMHPLVHEWSKARMTDVQQREGWKNSVSTLAGSIRISWNSLDEAYRRYLLPHISAAIDDCVPRLFEEGPDLQARLTIAEKFSIAYNENFREQEALDLDLETLRWRLTIFPPEHQCIVGIKKHIGMIYFFLGRYKEALEIEEALLELLKRTQGHDSQSVLDMMYKVAMSYVMTGCSELALAKTLDAYEACKRVLGKESALTMKALDAVSAAHYERAEWEEAARAGETALEFLKQKDQWIAINFIINIMHRVAGAYEELKQFEKSRRLCLTAVEISEGLYGKESKEAALATWQCASAIPFDPLWRKQYQELRLRKEAFRKMEAAFGKTDLRTLRCMGCLAEGYFLCGLWRKARRIQEDQVHKLMNHFGEDNSETKDAKRDLARTQRCISIQEALYWWLPKRMLIR